MPASIVCVAPLGYDDIETPHGTYRHLLGGSAFFFGLAAAIFAPTRIVAAVGSDFDARDLALLATQGVDVSRVARLEGRTHHWSARYAADLSTAETLVNDLGVMDAWEPVLPEQCPGDLLYIGSLGPRIQAAASRSAQPGVFTVFDTQSHWIARDRDAVLEACTSCAMACLNEDELMQLTRAATITDAAAALLEGGNEALVVKSGARGASLFHRQGQAFCPSLPPDGVEDPTGAGDSFAGGMVGHLATLEERDFAALSEALAYGVACASIAVGRPAGRRAPGWSITEVQRRRRKLLPQLRTVAFGRQDD